MVQILVGLELVRLARLHVNTLVLQYPDLNAAVFGASLCSLVVCRGLGLTKAERLDESSQIEAMHADKVLDNGFGPSLAESAIPRRVTGGIRKSDDVDQPA